ncbi:type II toxin-antitoxin system ParD family antitoxin, partial [Methylobacterium sp. E-046]
MAVREPITISVSPELRAFLQGCVATGRYSSVSEVVRAALREFERAEMGK